jgi:hypothetical protein
MQQALEALSVVRCRGSHMLGSPLLPGILQVFISVRGRIEPRAIVQLEG